MGNPPPISAPGGEPRGSALVPPPSPPRLPPTPQTAVRRGRRRRRRRARTVESSVAWTLFDLPPPTAVAAVSAVPLSRFDMMIGTQAPRENEHMTLGGGVPGRLRGSREQGLLWGVSEFYAVSFLGSWKAGTGPAAGPCREGSRGFAAGGPPRPASPQARFRPAARRSLGPPAGAAGSVAKQRLEGRPPPLSKGLQGGRETSAPAAPRRAAPRLASPQRTPAATSAHDSGCRTVATSVATICLTEGRCRAASARSEPWTFWGGLKGGGSGYGPSQTRAWGA